MVGSRAVRGVVAGCAIALAACAGRQSGGGTGALATPQGSQRVQLFWTSDDRGQSGTMEATVGPRTFTGPFFQIRQEVQGSTLGPLWSPWPYGWTDWPYFGPVPPYEFSTIYTGKVVANLSSPDGGHMRCRLHLANPSGGMSGGGEGECQIQGDGTIQAALSAR